MFTNRYLPILTLLLMSWVMMSFGQQSVPNHIRRKLKRDAARLAIRMDAQGSDLSLQRIAIPTREANFIYDLLIDVYNSDLDESNKVFDCNIRAATDVSIDKFWIIYDKNVAWASDIEDGIFDASGEMGDLLDEYDLFITNKNIWKEGQNILTIEAAKLYNIEALVQKFQHIEGLLDIVTHNTDSKPDSDIKISKIANEWRVSFEKKWTSIQGQRSHVWTFKINDQSKKVKFVTETGDDIPEWMQCQILVASLDGR